MNDATKIKFSDFEQSLTPEMIRTIKIIQGTLGSGVILFALVIYVISQLPSFKNQTADSSILSILPILTGVHLIFGIVALIASRFVFKSIVNESKVHSFGTGLTANPSLANQSIGEKCLTVIKIGIIMRSAMFEGVAFFGLVICLLGVLGGVLKSNPIYLINTISALLYIVYTIWTFPSKEKLEEIFKLNIAFEY